MLRSLRLVGATLAWVALVACTDVHIKGAWCTQNSDCTTAPFLCDVPFHACRSTADDMSGGGNGDGSPDMPMAMCTSATAAKDCQAAAPICGSNGSCRACMSGDDAACANRSAATPRCMPSGDTNAGQCVACVPTSPATQSNDCTMAMSPICNIDGSCRACQAHAECTSGVCILDGTSAGTCANVGQVSVVDNGNMTVAACDAARTTRDGSTANPYCDVSEAVSSGKPFALVKGSSQPYGAITLNDQTITIVGPGKSATSTAVARLYSNAAVSVTMNATTGAHTVILDGLELAGDVNNKSLRGVVCTNNTSTVANATLTVRNSGIHDSSDVGILSNGCTLIADADIIGLWGAAAGNLGGGIILSGTNSATITNSIIAGNGSVTATTGGVTIDKATTLQFAFNTVVRNTVVAGVGGADCGSGAIKSIVDSIFYKNTTSGGSQLGPQCSLTNVVTAAGDDNRGTESAAPPTFVSASDFHLIANDPANIACCIDKVTSPGTPNMGHDVDLTIRPKGAAYDIGAHEVQ